MFNMEKKIVKFRKELAELILAGEKTITWRLFDDKNISKDDALALMNWDTRDVFAEAVAIEVREKKLGELEEADFDGHEKFESDEDMYATYKTYYGDRVGPDTVVKIIRFKLS